MVQTAASISKDPRKGRKRTTQARCKSGLRCGITCINRNFVCSADLQKGAKGLAQEIRRLVGRKIDQGDFSNVNAPTRQKLIDAGFIDEPSKGAIGAAAQSAGPAIDLPEQEVVDLSAEQERDKLEEEREQRKRERERRRRREG